MSSPSPPTLDRRAFLASSGALLVTACAPTATSTRGPSRLELKDPVAEATALLHFSGLDDRLDALGTLGRTFTGELRKRIALVPEDEQPDPESVDEVAGAIEAIAEDAYIPRVIGDDVIVTLAHGPTSERQGALRHFEGPRATEARVYERQTETGPGQNRVALFLSLTKDKEERAAWVQLGKHLVEASGEVELMTRLSFDVSADLKDACAPLLGVVGDPVVADAQRAEQRKAFVERTRLALTLRAGFVLSRFAENDRLALVRFWESPAGRWFAKTRFTATSEALNRAARKASAHAADMHAARALPMSTFRT